MKFPISWGVSSWQAIPGLCTITLQLIGPLWRLGRKQIGVSMDSVSVSLFNVSRCLCTKEGIINLINLKLFLRLLSGFTSAPPQSWSKKNICCTTWVPLWRQLEEILASSLDFRASICLKWWLQNYILCSRNEIQHYI